MRSFPKRCSLFITLLTGAASHSARRGAEKEDNIRLSLGRGTGIVLEEEG